MADFNITVQAKINPSAIQAQLNSLGKKTSITVDMSGQPTKQIDKIQKGLYSTQTTVSKLNKATQEWTSEITTVNDGIKKQRDELNQAAKIEKAAATERARQTKLQVKDLQAVLKVRQKGLQVIQNEKVAQYAQNAQTGINKLVAPGLSTPAASASKLKQMATQSAFADPAANLKAYGNVLNDTEKKILKTQIAQKKLNGSSESFGQTLAHNMKAAATWAVAMGVLYGTLRKVQEGLQFAYDFENQMNNIRMVTGLTTPEVDKLAQSYAAMATRLSTTTMAVAQSAEVWLRQGRSISDTNTLIEASQVFAKVGFLESAEAAELLTSAINGYQMSASQAMSVIDKMSAIDVNAATSTEDLANAMSQTAASASLAGVSIDELLSYIAVVSDVTQQSAQSIGNSFKTIFARMQQVKIGSLLDEEGEDISRVDTVLKQYGISLRDAQGQFRDTSTVLKELAGNWKQYDSTQKSEIATTIAGVRQRDRFLVLMQNFDKALKLEEISLTSAGSAMDKFAIYQESGAAASERLTNEFQKMFLNLDSGIIKGFINAGASILNFINDAGGLSTILTAIIGLLIALKGEAVMGAVVGSFTKLITVLKGTATAAMTTQVSLGAIALIITAIVAGISLYNNAQKEMMQNAITAGATLKTEAESLNDVRIRINEITTSSESEAKQRTDLISLIQSINSEYDTEAARLKTVNDLRSEAISKLKEESAASAENFLTQNQAGIAIAERLLNKDYSRMGGGGKNAKEHLAGLKANVDEISAQYEKTHNRLALEGLKTAQKQYNDFLTQYENALAVLQQRDMAERIQKGLSPIPAPLGQYGMAEATNPNIRNTYVPEKIIPTKTPEEIAAEIAAAKKKQEDLLRTSIQITKNRIEAEKKAVEDALNAEIDLLKKTNDQRQNEIDLINAKEQLLNAQAQKIRRVYREGQGWVWEADKQAIKDAEANLAKLNQDAVIRKKEEERDKAVAKENDKMKAYETTLLTMMKLSKDEGTRSVIGEALNLTEYKGGWYNQEGQKVFKNGGLANFTGTAWMDGTSTRPEVTLNNQQAAGLFNYIKGMANPSVSRPAIAGAGGGGRTINIGTVNLPSVKNGMDFVKELEIISKNR